MKISIRNAVGFPNEINLTLQILDLIYAKIWGLKYATETAATIMRVDQIIMAKKAGGIKAREGKGPMDTHEEYLA